MCIKLDYLFILLKNILYVGTIYDIKNELPCLKNPISLLIDDWSVGYIGEGKGTIEDTKFEKCYEFAKDLVKLCALGVRGKLTLLPYVTKPEGDTYRVLGRIDEGIEGIPSQKLLEVLSLVKGELMKYFDITPEILTHTLALDIETGTLINESEWEWSNKQDLKTLTKYIAHGLRILKNVGIVASGITCPCDFGKEVEGILAKAVLDAEKIVNNITLTWYFLHVQSKRIGWDGSSVNPRLMYLNEENKEAVVSIISGSAEYINQKTIDSIGPDPYRLADQWITVDGEKGRLAELLKNKAYIIFHIHWYNSHGRDNKVGFLALKELTSRIRNVWADKVLWMKCSEVARYFAASKTWRTSVAGDKIILSSPFDCPLFTISFATNKEVKCIKVDGKKLKKKEKPPLEKYSWTLLEDRVYACFKLSERTIVDITFK